ncbi:MAG: SDR family oxidoreductase [Anaerolineales bacterium]
MILVTGAAGKTGRAVIRALVARGEAVRALVRRPAQLDQAKAIGAVEVEIGDLLDPNSLEPIFAGMRAVYHIGPNAHPAEVEIGRNAISVARAAEIPHFVMHSVLHPQTQAMPHHWNKLLIEEQLIDSDMGFTILQPASYMQNVRGVWASVVEGHYPVPYPTEVRFSPVDLRDVAHLAAEVLSAPGHEGAIYELAGPELLTPVQMARRLSEALGRPVEAVEISRDRWRREAELDPDRADILLIMFEYYAEHGFWGNPRVLAGLLGREPTTFAQYLRRLVREGGVDDE